MSLLPAHLHNWQNNKYSWKTYQKRGFRTCAGPKIQLPEWTQFPDLGSCDALLRYLRNMQVLKAFQVTHTEASWTYSGSQRQRNLSIQQSGLLLLIRCSKLLWVTPLGVSKVSKPRDFYLITSDKTNHMVPLHQLNQIRWNIRLNLCTWNPWYKNLQL